MKAKVLSLTGSEQEEIELPIVFSTPFRKDLIHKAYTNLSSHKFQPQGRHPTAGMDVVARPNNPPTGQGMARIARLRGGGGGRQGEAGGVASTRGGRQAHPPKVDKVIYKKLNKKENKLALCSSIAATSSKDLIEKRGHKVNKIKSFPIVVSDELESVSKSKDLIKFVESLQIKQDIDRLRARKARTGKSVLRGRKTKVGKSALFVVSDTEKLSQACGAIPGVDVRSVKNLSVLDLAPGSVPIRLTVFSKKALDEISKIKSPNLKLMEIIK